MPCCSTSPAKTWPNAVVVGKSIYLQFTVKMYFLEYQTVQFNFFSALPLSKKKKMSKALAKSNMKQWVYEIHCAHIFFCRASSEAFSFFFYPESTDCHPRLLDTPQGEL